MLGKSTDRGEIVLLRAAFTLIECLVAIAIIAILAVIVAVAAPQLIARADDADALGKIRQMGAAVLHYPSDHNGFLPPLFPGQVLEYEGGRAGRIVTECAAYLGVPSGKGKFLAARLMPRAYAKLAEPKDKNAMRVYVMNTAVTNNGAVVGPFGRVTTPGQPPTGSTPLGALSGAGGIWMMSTADQQQNNVASAPWRNNTPRESPLGKKRAVFRFDGSGDLVMIGGQ